MRYVAIGVVLLLATGVAAAEPSKVLILQSEGRADAKTRAKIDAAIVKLARTGTDQITPSEITYSDAAALVGCKPEDASCKDEVIGSLAVDELVITTVTPKPGGLEVSVKRIGKAGASREASMVVPADKADKLDLIAPLFVAKAITGPTPPPVEPTPLPVIGPQPPPVTEPKPPVTSPDTLPDLTKPVTPPPITTTEPAKPLDQPAGSDARERLRHRLRITGMASGGGMVLLGFILWGSASSVEGDVNNAIVRSKADLEALQELEAKGDRYARWGNFFVLGGLALGGVSTYFYVKARRDKRASSSAQLVPVLFDKGAGVGLSFGGAR